MNSHSLERGSCDLSSQPACLVSIPRWQRWQVWQRLQELSIPAHCLANGQLQVEINDGVAAAQLRSVVQQFRATRSELVAWVEQCWRLPADAGRESV